MTTLARLAPALLIATAVGCGADDEPAGGGGGGGDGVCDGDSAAHAAFEALWSDLDSRYAVFDAHLPDGDWAALGAERCAQVRGDMSDDALFDAMMGLLRELDDGHTTLWANALRRDEDAWVSVYPHYDDMVELEFNAEDNYLDGDLSWAADDWTAWGSIGDIGYISLTSMDMLSGRDHEGQDVQAADEAMGRALADLGGARGMIVDVRANEGGWDTVALAYAAHFAGDRAVAWSEARRDGPAHDDFGAWQDTHVEASGAGAYAGPVVVLTSGGTFSAAETFLLAMQVRDDVTLLGERSSGHFSDMLESRLPNGWGYTYSGERYRAADGEVYEGLGAPVDVALDFDPGAFREGRDVMLEEALALLGG